MVSLRLTQIKKLPVSGKLLDGFIFSDYLNAGIPVMSIPVISKWMSCVPS